MSTSYHKRFKLDWSRLATSALRKTRPFCIPHVARRSYVCLHPLDSNKVYLPSTCRNLADAPERPHRGSLRRTPQPSEATSQTLGLHSLLGVVAARWFLARGAHVRKVSEEAIEIETSSICRKNQDPVLLARSRTPPVG